MSAELKPGYQQTEVGVIPEDWDVKPLRQISPVQSVGLVINPSSYFDDKGTVPMLVGSNVQQNRIDWRSAHRISDASNTLIASSQVRAGDLVTVRVGEPGVTAVVPPELDGCNCASMMIVRQHRRFNSHWLCYMMNSSVGLNQVKNVQYGTAQKQFNISDAINFAYPFPSLAEQEAIAEALSDADALIESLEQLIAKKRQVKQGAMQELLTGKRRLPGFSGEWEVKRLGEVVDKFVNGGTPSTQHPEYWTGQIPWITGADILDQQVSEIRRYITEDAVRNSSTNVIEEGNLLLVSRTGVGKLAIAPFAVAISQDFTGVYIRQDRLIPEFLFRYFDYNSELLRQQNQGTSIQGITRETLASTPIPAPQLAEQTAIAAILSDMDAEIAALEAKLAKARQVKQGMMQELLTGRIRLV